MNLLKKIVFVEDDFQLAEMVSTFLRSEGYDVTYVGEGIKAISVISEQKPDLVLLDLMLPDIDGVEVCRRIRDFYSGAIIMLTAKNDELTEISALNIGADDYITKPIRPHILKARINSQFRKYERKSIPVDTIYQAGSLIINFENYTVSLKGKPINLTDSEFELLALLVKNAGTILSREEIFRIVRGIEYDGIDRSIDIRISSLRKKLGDDKESYQIIRTVRSKGYLFTR